MVSKTAVLCWPFAPCSPRHTAQPRQSSSTQQILPFLQRNLWEKMSKTRKAGVQLSTRNTGCIIPSTGDKEAMRNGNYEKRESRREEKREREEKRGSLT